MHVHSRDASGRPVTWDEFLELDEDDLRELVDGELVEVEVPNKWHEHIVAVLIRFLGNWAAEHDAGRVLGSGYKVRVSNIRGAMPDVQFLSKETWESAGVNGLAEGRPELAIEIVSPSSRSHDRVRKLEWYASIGVPEYWLVDPEARTVERLVLTNGGYTIAQAAQDGETFRPQSFEGFELPLEQLWPTA